MLPAGRRPGSRTVWEDPGADEFVGGFFSGTRATIETAHVRPTEPWWPSFQERAGVLLARALRDGTRRSAIVREFSALRAAVLDGARSVE